MNVINRATKLRLRRSLRNRQKQVESVTSRAETSFDSNFIDRLERLLDVKRFVLGWLLLVVSLATVTALQTVQLNSYYLHPGPVAGGKFNEGMLGTYSNANPIYATGPVDTSVSRLLFAGLLKYGVNNELVGDLATGYTVDASGRQYTLTLKPGLTWHDGTAITAKDVVFTYQLIQNPDTRSPLLSSWQGIVVAASNPNTVVFTLPSALTAFPHSLTTGIVPFHILGDVPVFQLRSDSFNTTTPVGAGPFMWDNLQLGSGAGTGDATTLISLKAFQNYNAGAPKLDGFVLHVYDEEDQLVAAYKKRSIEAIAGVKNVPEALKNDTSVYLSKFTTTAATMLFFRTSEGLLADATVRKALALATDRQALIEELGGGLRPVNAPLLIGQLGYAKEYAQTQYDPALAISLLEKAGWVQGKNGVRSKNNQPLSFVVIGEDTPDNQTLLKQVKGLWKGIGADIQVQLLPRSDFQSSVETHSYAALLYRISIGPDPDVYAYWSSTQADPRSNNRLNFSEYKSAVADAALEGGRTRQDPLVRAQKYKPFLKAWQEDTPAIGLYQPVALYLTRGQVNGLVEHTINTDADRYYSVTEWAVKTGYLPK
ncbi:peptide ABC transporter substrate-binding protein [Candidatus Saccharibacteria bacterium]|nr:MAG: peptide ABC transporter substrate-binding protein [Candidatus Saccharibacteria bacterium]